MKEVRNLAAVLIMVLLMIKMRLYFTKAMVSALQMQHSIAHTLLPDQHQTQGLFRGDKGKDRLRLYALL